MKGKKREKICFYGAATASKSYISFIHLDWDIAFFISEGSLLLSDHCCQLPFWELCCLWYLWYFPLKKEATFCSSDEEECLWKFASFFFFYTLWGFCYTEAISRDAATKQIYSKGSKFILCIVHKQAWKYIVFRKNMKHQVFEGGRKTTLISLIH